jgi:hypothetical protein
VIRVYLRWSMSRELRDLERLIAAAREDPPVVMA